MAVNLSGGAGEDLKKMMSEHHIMLKEDISNKGISLDVQYLKQAQHLLRTTNYPIAIKYTVKALEINPESQVIWNTFPLVFLINLLLILGLIHVIKSIYFLGSNGFACLYLFKDKSMG